MYRHVTFSLQALLLTDFHGWNTEWTITRQFTRSSKFYGIFQRTLWCPFMFFVSSSKEEKTTVSRASASTDEGAIGHMTKKSAKNETYIVRNS